MITKDDFGLYSDSDGQLCERCQHRAASRRRVADAAARAEQRAVAGADSRVVVCDPTPKRECKAHEGYGEDPPLQRSGCRDFQAQEPPA